MSFSSVVKLADLDDFIAPSQNCVKPLMKPADAPAQAKENAGKRLVIEMETDSTSTLSVQPVTEFGQIKSDKVKKTASVSLNDCLACSGCVTSAETVLIAQQSTSELFDALLRLAPTDTAPNGSGKCIVTVSPHTRAALATKYDLSLLQVAKRLTSFFKSLGVHLVLDSGFALDIALLEARQEFVERYQTQKALPILAGECPGWVCYAEKTQGEVLPLMSTARSPQQIMGVLVKHHLAAKLGLSPSEIYHVTVMPCFDKKLEGSRDDFYNPEYKTRDVDLVLTTVELDNLFIEKKVEFTELKEAELDTIFNNVSEDQSVLYGAADVGGSGGYVENIFRFAAKQLFKREFDGELPYESKQKSNPDLKELTLKVEDKTVLSFATAYGFRNIQNVVRKLKRKGGEPPYHYVEIMACPSGCTNGGAQIKSESKEIKAQRVHAQAVDNKYHTYKVRDPADNEVVKRIYTDWVKGAPYSEAARRLFHTQFHAVEKSQLNGLAVKW